MKKILFLLVFFISPLIAEDHYRLAGELLRAQEQDKAFKHFLTALEKAKPSIKPWCEEEKKIYDEAYNCYLQGMEPEQLLEKFEKEILAHPNYSHLAFLLSTAYANCGKFDLFFTHFYNNYDPDHFLALKTKAILHLRLSMHEVPPGKSNDKAIALLEKALEKNGKDPSLYRVLYVLSSEKEKKVEYLEKMAQNEVIPLRKEIMFYVTECVDLDRKDLGKKIVAMAKSAYQYSKAVMQAEECLK